MPQLAITHTKIDGILVVEPSGDIDIATADQFRAALIDHVESVVDAVIVRLDGATFLDSRGITALVVAYKAAAARGVTFCLATPSQIVTKALQITGLPKAIPTYPTVQDAINATQP